MQEIQQQEQQYFEIHKQECLFERVRDIWAKNRERFGAHCCELALSYCKETPYIFQETIINTARPKQWKTTSNNNTNREKRISSQNRQYQNNASKSKDTVT